MLGNIAYAHWLLGEHDTVRELLRDALEQGGEALRDGELADTEIHPVAEDEGFRSLVKAVWNECERKR